MSIEKLSDEQLQSMIDNHPEANGSQRGASDWGRDIAYGLAEGSPMGIGQYLGELLGIKSHPTEESLNKASILPKSKKDLMNLGGYEFNPQYEAEGIRSPNSSEGGDRASLIAEFLSPMGMLAKGTGLAAKGGKELMNLGTKANDIRKSIPLTQKAAGRMKEIPLEKYGHIEEPFISKDSSRAISKLFEHPELAPYKHHIDKLLGEPGLKSADQIQSILYNLEKQFGRKGDYVGQRVAGVTKGTARGELTKGLAEHAGEQAPKEWEQGQNAYKNYKTYVETPRDMLLHPWTHMGHLIHKLLRGAH